ncbi:HAD family hydrolase [Microbacterium sp. BH-3-3-3]|uniref:HAD family hydrolase n=1 Tax=Microbacterium sp. BH-3-3-3 TaxID=1906742 RepID=UPI00119CE8B7|nr:HAD family hydrolase [Microbacterium sp. BH-3-3-3]
MGSFSVAGIRCVVFDVGETLVDESRMWAAMADSVGASPFTVMGLLGVFIERGEDHRNVWSALDVATPASVEVGLPDIYPDVMESLQRLRDAGLDVGIAGNQPRRIAADLRDAGVEADFVGSSADWGIRKPAPGFFEHVVTAAGQPPERILYVGDRLDNDVLPARAAGMKTAHIRRGPWGHVHAKRPQAASADLHVDGLRQIADMFAPRDDLSSHR